MDEPDPTGAYKPICPASNLKAESDWIHANDPGAKTFILVMNMSSSSNPSYQNTYNPANSDIDFFGLDPYPCRTELNGCDDSYINKDVAAAETWGIPQADIVPVFQAFGGGTYVDDGGGQYAVPTVAQEEAILSTWAVLIPDPVFDYAYSWGTQQSDTSLDTLTGLQAVFHAHNTGTTASGTTTTTGVTESPTTVPYGNESASMFSVNVTTSGGTPLPASEAATVNVGSVSCVANLTPNSAGGTGSCSIANTALGAGGPYPVTATYPGDATLASSSSSSRTGLTVTGVSTTTTLSIPRTSLIFGNESQSLSATVTSMWGSPSGIVTVTSSEGVLCSMLVTAGSGSCQLGAAGLPVGSFSNVVAAYGGSADFAGSSSAANSLTVAKDSTLTKVSVNPSTISHRNESAAVFSATVTTTFGEAVPNGEIITVTVGSATCVANVIQGRGSCGIGNARLGPGSYSIAANYSGDANLTGSSTSSGARLRVT